jgi:hypothetical protein
MVGACGVRRLTACGKDVVPSVSDYIKAEAFAPRTTLSYGRRRISNRPVTHIHDEEEEEKEEEKGSGGGMPDPN